MKTKTQAAIAFTLLGASIAIYIGFIVWGISSHA
jgi:hypothetical protein